VTVLGTGTATVYDSLTATGTVIFQVPASAAVGSVYDVQIPFGTGLSAASAASGPGLLLTWS
jgi:hypothetical protein